MAGVCIMLISLCGCSPSYEGIPQDGRPHINSPRIYGNRVGTEFLYTIAATGDKPMTFSAKGLPEGLVLDEATGFITGTPTAEGEYAVTVTVQNSKGVAKATLRFVIGDMLALTPPMGWMSWNAFGPNISETLIREIADAMVASGMRDVGYQYICIDDHWHGFRAKGMIHPDPEKFPNGIKPVADYVHSKGLKLGIYSDAAEHTCGGEPGSYGYEQQDAQRYAEWGIDYLKYDYCGAPKDRETAIARYGTMAEELKMTDRTIVFAACEWGQRQPWDWAANIGGHLWRTTWDIRDTWDHRGRYDSGHAGIVTILDKQADLWQYAGPGRWNDPDMLVVGLRGKGISSSHDGANGCTDTEYRSNMSLWSLLAAPLLASCDLRTMDETTRQILTNPEVIAINQDPLGQQARRVYQQDEIEIWVKMLEDDHLAVGILNRSGETVEFEATWPSIGIEGRYGIRDLWARENCEASNTSICVSLKSHETALFRLWPMDTSKSQGK